MIGCVALLTGLSAAPGPTRPVLVFACAPRNDAYVAICRSSGRRFARYDTPREAIDRAPRGAGVLLLADGYPSERTSVPANMMDQAVAKRLRIYVEYPDACPGIEPDAPRSTIWERVVVASQVFGPELPPMRIVALHGCRYLTARHEAPDLVVARVAGFDTAVYGLPPAAGPLLYEPLDGLIVATAKLSGFVSGRAAPPEAWQRIWRHILGRLQPGAAAINVRWEPVVRPSYDEDARLPADAELRSLRRAIAWFSSARMLVHPAWSRVYDDEAVGWPDRIGPAPSRAWPSGDGSLGVLEGFDSAIAWDGSQRVRWWRRNDCNGEAAGAFAIASKSLRRPEFGAIAGRIGDFLYERSILANGKRADPADTAFGLIGWNDVTKYHGDMDGYGVYYGDDQARSMLGMMLAAATLGTDRWDERLLRCLYANLSLANAAGYQPDRIDTAPLEAAGKDAYARSTATSFSPHYQSYMWACYLWGYRRTGDAAFLERAERGLRLMMDAYPERWQWVGSRQIERSRLLLALAWLVRVADTPEHRAWLRRIASDLLAEQHASGGIREVLGEPGRNQLPPPASNEAYGTAEIPIIQSNDDAACDLLYACNFALIGLHEAAAATGEPMYRDAEDRLARFFVRAQVRSTARPELDGAWFRAFDLDRWEYWASSGDAGWGAWCIESGWTQTWVSIVLSLRRLGTSLWDATAGQGVPTTPAPGRASRKGTRLLQEDRP